MKNSLRRKCTTNTFGVCHQLRLLAAFKYKHAHSAIHTCRCSWRSIKTYIRTAQQNLVVVGGSSWKAWWFKAMISNPSTFMWNIFICEKSWQYSHTYTHIYLWLHRKAFECLAPHMCTHVVVVVEEKIIHRKLHFWVDNFLCARRARTHIWILQTTRHTYICVFAVRAHSYAKSICPASKLNCISLRFPLPKRRLPAFIYFP